MNKHFLQSKEWEEFQGALGRKVRRVDDALVIKFPLALGKSYLYAAGVNFQFSIFNFQKLARESNAVFLKYEPMADDKSLAGKLLGVGFSKSKKEIQPQRTIILDIMKSEEELLIGMHEKTRYNIRLAGKKDLRFKVYDFPSKADPPLAERFEEFWKLTQKTSERDSFHTHEKTYYQKLLEMPPVKLFGIEHNGKLIAASIVLFYGNKAYYLHGASDYKYRNLMAPYLLHWEIIKYAKENGFSEYDLWGVDEKKWPGVTRFKQGFRGIEINYIGSYDYVFQPFWYALYKARQSLKK